MQVMKTTESEETIHRVIDALSTVAETDPVSMSPTLYAVIDPDALDRLLDTDRPVEVQFDYDGHRVVVDSNGTVSVDGIVFESDAERMVSEQRANDL